MARSRPPKSPPKTKTVGDRQPEERQRKNKSDDISTAAAATTPSSSSTTTRASQPPQLGHTTRRKQATRDRATPGEDDLTTDDNEDRIQDDEADEEAWREYHNRSRERRGQRIEQSATSTDVPRPVKKTASKADTVIKQPIQRRPPSEDQQGDRFAGEVNPTRQTHNTNAPGPSKQKDIPHSNAAENRPKRQVDREGPAQEKGRLAKRPTPQPSTISSILHPTVDATSSGHSQINFSALLTSHEVPDETRQKILDLLEQSGSVRMLLPVGTIPRIQTGLRDTTAENASRTTPPAKRRRSVSVASIETPRGNDQRSYQGDSPEDITPNARNPAAASSQYNSSPGFSDVLDPSLRPDLSLPDTESHESMTALARGTKRARPTEQSPSPSAQRRPKKRMPGEMSIGRGQSAATEKRRDQVTPMEEDGARAQYGGDQDPRTDEDGTDDRSSDKDGVEHDLEGDEPMRREREKSLDDQDEVTDENRVYGGGVEPQASDAEQESDREDDGEDTSMARRDEKEAENTDEDENVQEMPEHGVASDQKAADQVKPVVLSAKRILEHEDAVQLKGEKRCLPCQHSAKLDRKCIVIGSRLLAGSRQPPRCAPCSRQGIKCTFGYRPGEPGPSSRADPAQGEPSQRYDLLQIRDELMQIVGQMEGATQSMESLFESWNDNANETGSDDPVGKFAITAFARFANDLYDKLDAITKLAKKVQ